MTDSWASPYEAPISLDAARVLGTKPMRSTLWHTAAVIVSVPTVALFCAVISLNTFLAAGNEAMADTCATWLLISIPPAMIMWIVAWVMASDFGRRPAEHWISAWTRHRRLPGRLVEHSLIQHHSKLTDVPRGCIEVIGTANLRMLDEATLSTNIKKLGAFFNGLRFPIQIIVRAWPGEDGIIERKWLIALTAQTEAVLKTSVEAIVEGLKRAGLRSYVHNGTLYDTIQTCWTSKPSVEGRPGPLQLDRSARHVVVDGEYVRGFMLTRYPRVVDANWLAPLLDGDLACDFSMWLDPTDNADERNYLGDRIMEWKTAQELNIKNGTFDVDIDDQIKDASRTRLLISRRELRVFRATVAFAVRGQTEREMKDREALLLDQMRERVGDEALLALDYQHDLVPLMVVPTGEIPIEYPLRVVTPALARGHMFSNSSVNQRGGVDVGTSIGSKRTNRINPFSIINPHMLVLGTTGAGKGFWVKIFLYRLLMAVSGMLVYIIQAEKDEYSKLAEYLGPELAEIVRIKSLEDLTHESRLPAKWPIITDRYGDTRPRTAGVHEAVPGIIYRHSGTLKTFRKLQLYDLTGLPQADRGKAIAWLLQAIENTFAGLPSERHGLVVVDELGIVLRSAEAAQAIDTAYRRFRSIPTKADPHKVNRLGMLGISQMPSDLLSHPIARTLADLATTQVYFRQKSTELRRVAGQLGLSEDEQNFLDAECDEGTGLLVADRARVGFHLYANEKEIEFART